MTHLYVPILKITDKAIELLESAGEEGLTLSLLYLESDDVNKTQAILIQEQLSKVGITVTLEGTDSGAYVTYIQDPDSQYDMFLGGYIMGTDPDTYKSLFTSDGASNYMNYASDEVDDLFLQGQQTYEHEARVEIYNELQAEIQDDAVFYPIVSNNKILVINDRIGGVEDSELLPIYTFKDASKLTIQE